MTARLKQLREHPLLSPPHEAESPWLELSPRDIKRIHERLNEDIRRKEWGSAAEHAMNMKMLGLDVPSAVGEHEGDMRKALDRHAGKAEWGAFMPLAAAMAKLGMDVKRDVRRNEGEIWAYYRHLKEHGDEPFMLKRMVDMNALGFDTRNDAAAKKRIFLDGAYGAWDFYTDYMADARLCGIDVRSNVDRNVKWIRDELGEKSRGDAGEFLRQAAGMAALGLLTPNPGRSIVHGWELPPLRRFAR